MLTSDDNTGIVTFLLGIIVLVLCAVGLSLLVDKRFKFSSSASTLKAAVEGYERDIESLKDTLSAKTAILETQAPKLGALAERLKSNQAERDAGATRLARLRTSRSDLATEIAGLEESFRDYRANYRAKTRSAAVGQPLGNLITKGGREFKQAVIVKVTDVGLEIRHENGNARIHAPDLDAALQDRFQWSDEERRLSLNKEGVEHKAITAEPARKEDLSDSRPPREVEPPRSKRARIRDVDPVKLEAARKQVKAWKARVAQLTSEHSQATSSASYGNQSSVPGSLETWQARAARLSGQLAKARAELAAARQSLEEIDPNDALLRPQPGALDR